MITVVIALYFLAMVGVGIYGRKYAQNFDDYLTAGKQSTMIMIIGSAIGSHIGAGFVVGGAESGAMYGIGGAWYGIGCALSYLVSSFVITKFIYRGGYLTLSDYYYERYGDKNIRLIYSLSTSISFVGMLGSQIMAGKAIFMSFGLDGNLGAIITAVVVLIYASIAGLWGAFMTSVIQTAIIGVSLVVRPLVSPLLVVQPCWPKSSLHPFSN